jgi:hypothetical protein
MFIATAHLALSVTGTRLQQYVQVQLGAFVTAGATCGLALATRLVLEARHASSTVITLTVLIAAAVPWSAGISWTLGDPDCEQIAGYLPSFCASWPSAVRRLGRRRLLPLSGNQHERPLV